MILVAGSGILASQIASKLRFALVAQTEISRFASGEVRVELRGKFFDQNAYIVIDSPKSPNDSFMELFLMIDTIKNQKPKSITVIIPYMSYARQDEGETTPIACIANILKFLGVDKIITIDIHSDSARNAFKIPLVNIEMTDIFAILIKKQQSPNAILISPDEGSKERVDKLSAKLNIPYAIIEKSRDSTNSAKAISISKEVTNKQCIVIDDIVDTGGTLLSAVNLLFSNGAQAVHGYITHGLFSKDCLELIYNSPLNSLTVTNTVEFTSPTNINIIDISEIIAHNIHALEKDNK